MFVMRQMVQNDEVPDDSALQVIFRSVDTARRLDEAVDLLDQLRHNGQAVNEVVFAALLGSCGRVHQLVRAFEVFAKAREDEARAAGGSPSSALSQRPSPILYSTLIDACRSAEDGAAAVRVFEDMCRAGVDPSVEAYTSLLGALSKENEAKAKSMRRRSAASPRPSKPTSPVQSGLVSFLREVGGVKDNATYGSTRKHKTEASAGDLDASGSPRSFSVAVPSPVGVGDEALLGLGAFLRDIGATPTRTRSGSATSSSSSAFRLDYTDPAAPPRLSILKSPHTTHARGTPSDGDHAPPDQQAMLLKVFLVFRDMQARGLEPDLPAYNALMSACAR